MAHFSSPANEAEAERIYNILIGFEAKCIRSTAGFGLALLGLAGVGLVSTCLDVLHDYVPVVGSRAWTAGAALGSAFLMGGFLRLFDLKRYLRQPSLQAELEELGARIGRDQHRERWWWWATRVVLGWPSRSMTHA